MVLGFWFRVKAPVTRRPPHRSGREVLPHPVPRCYPFLRIGTTQATPRVAHNFAAPGIRYCELFVASAMDIYGADPRIRQRPCCSGGLTTAARPSRHIQRPLPALCSSPGLQNTDRNPSAWRPALHAALPSVHVDWPYTSAIAAS